MTIGRPDPFLLERWFAEFEFIPNMRNLAASGSYTPSIRDVLSLDGPEATQHLLSLGLDYIENPGGEKLRGAIAGLHTTLAPDDVQVTTGASEAILLLFWSVLETGDNIVVEVPCYESHDRLARAFGAEVRHLELRPEDGWKPDPDRLTKLLDRRTRLVILSHPHNPTGSMPNATEMTALLALAERSGAVLVCDEVFRPIALDGPQLPSVADLSERALAIGDLSKPWGLAGVRVGWCASHDRRRLRGMSELRDYTTMCASGPGEFLAEIAIRHSDTLLPPRLENARTNRAALADLVARSHGALRWAPPVGGYTAFLQLPEGVPAEPFCRQLAGERGIMLLPGSVFGPEYAAYVRIGFGGDPAIFQEGLAEFEESLSLAGTAVG